MAMVPAYRKVLWDKVRITTSTHGASCANDSLYSAAVVVGRRAAARARRYPGPEPVLVFGAPPMLRGTLMLPVPSETTTSVRLLFRRSPSTPWDT